MAPSPASHFSGRRLPPLGILIAICAAIYGSLSAGLTKAFGLPWQVPIPSSLGFAVGIPLLILGGGLLAWAFKSLGLKRAMGKELFQDRSKSKLIADGIYAHTRNPLYLSVTILFVGWFFVSLLTPLAFLTFLFLVHFLLVAKWEEKELGQRFGREYEEYRNRVPLFIPRVTGKRRDDSAPTGS